MPSSSPVPLPSWPTMSLMSSSLLLEVNSSLKVSDPFPRRVSILSFSWAFLGCYSPHPPSAAHLPPPSLGFTVREMRGKLAIGITANFVNKRTVEETQVPEISGVARIYNQSFFRSLLKATGQDPSLSQRSPPPA